MLIDRDLHSETKHPATMLTMLLWLCKRVREASCDSVDNADGVRKGRWYSQFALVRVNVAPRACLVELVRYCFTTPREFGEFIDRLF